MSDEKAEPLNTPESFVVEYENGHITTPHSKNIYFEQDDLAVEDESEGDFVLIHLDYDSILSICRTRIVDGRVESYTFWEKNVKPKMNDHTRHRVLKRLVNDYFLASVYYVTNPKKVAQRLDWLDRVEWAIEVVAGTKTEAEYRQWFQTGNPNFMEGAP